MDRVLDAAQHIVLIGGGKMGEAILGGWIASDQPVVAAVSGSSITVAEPGAERRAYLEERYGVRCVADGAEIQQADIVVLAVKPQVMMNVLAGLHDCAAYQCAEGTGPLFISIAAGLPTARLEEALPAGAHLVRVMPNLPLLVGQGATGVTAGVLATDDDVALVQALFAALGTAVVVDEEVMDAVCAVSGSGPAYVAAMIESLRDAGEAAGLAPDLAEELALHTVYGTAKMIAQTDIGVEELRISVCSPGGTTLAALDAMNEAGFDQVFAAGVEAAVRRSKELAAQ